jgi:hypothetical protein
MKQIFSLFELASVLVAMLTSYSTAGDPAALSKGSPWMTDYAQALRLARRSDKPLFVVFRCEH